MRIEVKQAFKDAIIKSLVAVQSLSGITEPHLVWSNQGNRNWTGECKEQPSLLGIFTAAEKALEQNSLEFVSLFRTEYPEYVGLVGFAHTGLMNILYQPSYIVGTAVGELYERNGSFLFSTDEVQAIVDEFEEFVDQPTVRFKYSAQILNFDADLPKFRLNSELSIRKLDDTEFNQIYGGSQLQLMSLPNHFPPTMHEYILEGICDEPKVFGDFKANDSPIDVARISLDRAILALRTFKEGMIGYDFIRYKPIKFCPITLSLRTHRDLYVPFGRYHLSREEIESFQSHAGVIFSKLDPIMELACSRLADSQTRLKAQDRLIDAVIGLEAILLAALTPGDRRSELRYRFSLNYSTLFRTPKERYHAFRVAKDLYDLRSRIAHGDAKQDGAWRVGDEKLSLDFAAQRASQILREVIAHFLSMKTGTPYKDDKYWERGFFNLPPEL